MIGNLIEAIRGKSNCKAVGSDNIPYEILKKLLEQGIDLLITLFNKINHLECTLKG